MQPCRTGSHATPCGVTNGVQIPKNFLAGVDFMLLALSPQHRGSRSILVKLQ